MTLTLRARLAAIATAVFGLLIAGLGVASYQVLARSLVSDADQRLAELANGLHGYLRVTADSAVVTADAADRDEAVFIGEATRYFQVFDVPSGRLLAQSGTFVPLGLTLTPDEVRRIVNRPEPVDLETPYGRLRVANSPGLSDAGRPYLLRVGVSLTPLEAALQRYRQLLLGGLPVVVLAGAFVAWALSAVALRPLSAIAVAAESVDVNSLDRRLPRRGTGDELDRVAQSFNGTLDRLEAAVDEMRQFSAALAHELRTPLAVLRGEIELSLRAPDLGAGQAARYASQIEEVDRLSRLIDQILTLARAESGQIPLLREPVDVGALAASLVEQLLPLAEAAEIDLRCEAPDSLMVVGDPTWLRRLLLNLLDNALRFTPGPGRVVLRVARDGDMARIDAADSGVGLTPQDAARVFERFFRVDQARSRQIPGSGLGLSLVHWIVTQHRGTITVESRPGHGTTFTVRLPALPRA
ncbi:MAG: ATP-binding protein [Vicinamibacterales bacterium]